MESQWVASNAATLVTWAFIALAGRVRFGYRFRNLRALRREAWRILDGHDGPVIWAANHLTLVDSFLIFWALFPWRKVWEFRRLPWSTPEYTNYYRLGGPFYNAFVRILMYLCRCIPFLRGGDDEASERWRERAFEKCVWVLKNGGTVFVFPEATRARNGWLDPTRPKDFLGRLWLRVPEAKFLLIYQRGEGQLFTTVYPPRRERIRTYVEPWDPSGLDNPRDVATELFARLGRLQNRWFADSGLARNCGGNDVVDLGSPAASERIDRMTGEADPDWLERHLTPGERERFFAEPAPSRFRAFWKFVAAKEACHKALAQTGVVLPAGGWQALEVDLFQGKALHRPTGAALAVAFPEDDADKIHCLAVLRGGRLGPAGEDCDVLWGLDELPPGENPSDFARERCLRLIAESSDDIPGPGSLAFTEEEGVPKVLRAGKTQDWGVSLSHSGRFVAYSFMIS